jgi:hypothetical protein
MDKPCWKVPYWQDYGDISARALPEALKTSTCKTILSIFHHHPQIPSQLSNHPTN